MATAKTNVIIGDKKVDPYHVSVQQRSDAHHQFEIAVSTEKIEGKNSLTIDNSIENIGQYAEISIACATGNFQFKGLITSIRIDRTYTGSSLIILSGHSPTYMLEDGVGTKSYEEKTLATIANEILGTYPANILNPRVSPQYSTPIPYVVRYKETNYQFLSRLAAIYGEWFYYDGESIVFGKLPNPKSITLTLGKDLQSFDYGVQMRPSKFKYQFYNYQENRTLETASTSFKPGWLDNYGKKVLDAADSVFPNEPVNTTLQDAPKDALIKHLAEVKKSSILSDITSFKGQSSHAGIMVGGRIQAKGVNKIGNENVSSMIGNFRVTSVTHYLDANKDYHNTFEAIPMTVTAPPMKKKTTSPIYQNPSSSMYKNSTPLTDQNPSPSMYKNSTSPMDQNPSPAIYQNTASPNFAPMDGHEESTTIVGPKVAVVMENNDPDGLGRVRVQFKYEEEDKMTPWIRQITNYAGLDRGVYFVPEIGDEVYINFEDGNIDRPFMLGAVYSPEIAPEFFDPDNNIKSIKTRSGHTIRFSDEEEAESITITDKNDNHIIINTAEDTINIKAAADINVEAGGNMNFKAGGNVTWDVTGNIERIVGASVKTEAGVSVSTKAGASFEVIAASKAHIIGEGNVLLKSGASVLFLLPPGIGNMAAAISSGLTSGVYTPVIGGVATQIKGGATVNIDGGKVAINS